MSLLQRLLDLRTRLDVIEEKELTELIAEASALHKFLVEHAVEGNLNQIILLLTHVNKAKKRSPVTKVEIQRAETIRKTLLDALKVSERDFTRLIELFSSIKRTERKTERTERREERVSREEEKVEEVLTFNWKIVGYDKNMSDTFIFYAVDFKDGESMANCSDFELIVSKPNACNDSAIYDAFGQKVFGLRVIPSPSGVGYPFHLPQNRRVYLPYDIVEFKIITPHETQVIPPLAEIINIREIRINNVFLFRIILTLSCRNEEYRRRVFIFNFDGR